jgi:CAI-1 autoinducer synthase
MELLDKAAALRAASPPLGAHLQRRLAEFAPRFTHEWSGRFVTHGRPAGPDAVRLDGNDYLAVTGHPDIVQAQLQSLRQRPRVCDPVGRVPPGRSPRGPA